MHTVHPEAGEVEWVPGGEECWIFRGQGDTEAFKLYSQAKLGTMREALAKLDRAANERNSNFRTEQLR